MWVTDATNGHAKASTPLTPQQQQEIVQFEMGLETAQALDYQAGSLSASGAGGGPVALALQTMPAFFIGLNDPLGGNPKGLPFTPTIFNLYDAWRSPPWREQDEDGGRRARRDSIQRGQALFNSRRIDITGVAGLNDDLQLASVPGTCGTCHDTPNAGNHSLAVPLNIGVADVNNPLEVSYLPVITL